VAVVAVGAVKIAAPCKYYCWYIIWI